MRKLKITEKLNKQIIELRDSRNDIENFSFNFLMNIHRHAALMHKLLGIGLDSELFEVAKSQYIVGLVSCWETFFRDTFIFLCTKKTDFRENIVRIVGLKEENIEILKLNNSIADYLSKSFNFQNFNDIESSFRPIFQNEMFKIVGNHTFLRLGLNCKIATDFCYEQLYPNHIELIGQIYEERHKIIHDANYRTNLTLDIMKKVESTFVVFPQLFAIYMCEKIYSFNGSDNLNSHELVKEKEITAHYLFTIKDILSTDWVIV